MFGKIISNSIIYTIVSVLQGAVGFIMLPFITYYLSPEEYGIVSVVMAITSFLSIIYTLSFEYSIIRLYHDVSDNLENVKKLFSSAIFFLCISGVLFTIILVLSGSSLFNIIAKGIDFNPYILLGILSVFFKPPFILYQALLRTQQKALRYGLFSIGNFLTNIILIVVFLHFFKLKALGIIYALVITSLLFSILTIIINRHYIFIKPEKKYLSSILSYSLPLIPDSLSGWAITMTDKLFLNNLKSTIFAGIYNIGTLFGDIINMFNSAVNQAFQPWFFEKMKAGKNGHSSIVFFAEIAICLYAIVAFSVSLLGKEILLLMVGNDFVEAWKLLPFLTFVFVINGLAKFYINVLYFYKSYSKYIPIVTICSALVNIILNMFFIPLWGMYGAAIASVLSMFFLFILSYYFSTKADKIPYKTLKMLSIVLVYGAASFLSFVEFSPKLYLSIIIKIGIILFFILISYLYYHNKIKYIAQSR
jgi:O-antigen/teichoic acid export membrane protein